MAFSLIEACWLAFDTLSVAAPSPEATIRLAQAGFLWCALLGAMWLAFVMDYTERYSRVARMSVAALTAWCALYGVLAVTNDAHGWVWSSWETVVDGDFLVVRYTLGPLAWAQTGFMWVAMTVSYGIILWTYAGSSARTRNLSRWIVTGALAPLMLNVAYMFGLLELEKDFTPIAMAVSSGAFALGLARYQLLELRPVARAALVEELQEGVLVLDPDGRVVDVNPAFVSAFGAEGWIGLPLSEVMPEMEAALGHTDEPARLGDRYYDLRVSDLTGSGGRSTGRLLLLTDVTRRREERAALHQANADLYNANQELEVRNGELDAFAHTVAHDLKNSIQGVLGYAEILRDDGPELDQDTHSILASDLVRSAVKMDTIVAEILLLAGVRQIQVEPRPIPMDAVLDEALERVAQTVVASGAAVYRPPTWPVAIGHAPWVEEIWVNYIANAAKYGGSTITLGADVTASGNARFWVHDDGRGIAPEAQCRLFVPFSRVGSGEVDGTGLGLSIVRRIVERLGGTCGVESEVGVGARFWFALPLAEAETVASGAAVA